MTASVQAFALEPLDTLFFRDARPFNQDDEGLAEAVSVFPPFPTAVAGALRAALARSTGWSETDGNWARAGSPHHDLARWLGDGCCTGVTTYRGPFLLRGDQGTANASYDLLFPCPHALAWRAPTAREIVNEQIVAGGHVIPRRGLNNHSMAEFRALRPIPNRTLISDRGPWTKSCAPQLWGSDASDFKPLTGSWIDVNLMKNFLGGSETLTPVDGLVLRETAILAREKRIGLARSIETHAAEEGLLYAAAKLRLRDNGEGGARYVLGAIVAMDAAPAARDMLAPIIPLGGEARAAAPVLLANDARGETLIDRQIAHVLPNEGAFTGDGGIVRFAIVLLTPALRPHFAEFQEAMLGAAHDRPVMIGGWDGRNGRPGQSAACHPAGSTFFFELTTHDGKAVRGRLEELRRQRVGAEWSRNFGFGEFVYGVWAPPAAGGST